MNIPVEILNVVKEQFADLVEFGKKGLDIDFPYFNVYEWKGEYLFSVGHKNWNDAVYNADQEKFILDANQSFNCKRNGIFWKGILQADRLWINK